MHNQQNPKKEHRKLFAAKPLGIILIFAALLLFGVLSASVGFYADDFYYATFFYDGLAAFIKRTAEHYFTVNGRALVHLVDEFVLLFRTNMFALLNPLLLFFFFYCSASIVLPVKEITQKIYFILSGLCVTFMLPIYIARETLYWITGSMNYLLPSVLAVLALCLQRKAVQNTKYRPAGLVLCFLCGATTEQGGAAACVFTFLFAFIEWIEKRKKEKKGACGWPMFFCALAGYLTVLLAPGTLFRMTYESNADAGSMLRSFLALSEVLMGENGILPYFVVLFLLISLVALRDRFLPKGFLFGFVIAAVLTVVGYGPFPIPFRAVLLCGVCVACSIVAAVVFFFHFPYRAAGYFLFAAVAVQAIMVVSPATYLRTMLPTVLYLTVCIAFLLVRVISQFRRHDAVAAGLGALLFLSAAAYIAPTIDGYRQNKEVIRENEQRILQYEKNGSAEICTDIVPPYSYNMFYDDGYFIQNFYQYYHLPDNPLLYYFSEDCPNLFYNGTRLTHPAKQSGQTVYLPLEPVVTALGGSLAWNGDVLTIRLNDAEVVCAENMLTFSGGHIDLSGRTQRHFGKLYWEDRLLFEVFGITCTKDAENQITVEFR